MTTFRYPKFGFTLAQAIDALMAYDCGATDSGINDDGMRAWVARALNVEMTADERASFLDDLAASMLDGPYEDVAEMRAWAEGL